MPPLAEDNYCPSDLRRKRRHSRDGGPDSKRIKAKETTENAVKRMNRKDLEQLVLDKIVEVMVANSNLGEMVRKYDRLNADFTKVNDKATVLRKQLSDLQEVTKRIKVLEETKSIRIPKITRSVGLQVTSVTKFNINNVSTNDGINKDVIDLVDDTKVDMTRNGGSVSDVHPQINDNARTGLKDSGTKPCSPCEKKDSDGLGKQSYVAKKSTGGKNGTKKLKASIESKEIMPISLLVKKSSGSDGIVITWGKKLETLRTEKILNYELEGAKGSEREKGDYKWSRIGEMIKPLPLPMACNLNNFKAGILYHFRVKVLMDNEVYYSNVSSIMI